MMHVAARAILTYDTPQLDQIREGNLLISGKRVKPDHKLWHSDQIQHTVRVSTETQTCVL